MINFSKLKLNETLEAQQKASENAAASGEKQRGTTSRLKQKDMMATKSGPTQKSDVVYANEEYFRNLNAQTQLYKAQEAARVNWRETLEEARGERPSDEGNHPYVSIMPHTKKAPNDGKKLKDAAQQASEQPMEESVSFCEAFDTLVNEKLETGPEFHNRMKERNKVPINPYPVPKAKPGNRALPPGMKKKPVLRGGSKDLRSDAEKMADATGPRPGSRYRGD